MGQWNSVLGLLRTYNVRPNYDSPVEIVEDTLARIETIEGDSAKNSCAPGVLRISTVDPIRLIPINSNQYPGGLRERQCKAIETCYMQR